MNNGVMQEAKAAVIARRAGGRSGEALAVWVFLHDHACTAAPCGSVAGIDAEEVAACLEFDAVVVESMLQAFRDKGLITADGMLAGWNKKRKNSTARTRALRARRKEAPSAVPESDAARRERLQKEMLAGHKKRGRIIPQ